MSQIEDHIKSPVAFPADLLAFVRNLSSNLAQTAKSSSASLVEKLHSIVDEHSGLVRLESRHFAQWMHQAFPHECPVPYKVDDGRVFQKSFWAGKRYMATVDE